MNALQLAGTILTLKLCVSKCVFHCVHLTNMKIVTYLLFALFAVGLVYVFSLLQQFSYFSLSKGYAEIGTLLLRPLDYNGKQICTAGKYTKGEGISELTDAENPTGTIWIAAPVEHSIFTSLWQQYIPSENPTKTSIAKVCGVFQVSESQTRGFGTNNQYQYQIIAY
jgi:hypothetical protein